MGWVYAGGIQVRPGIILVGKEGMGIWKAEMTRPADQLAMRDSPLIITGLLSCCGEDGGE